MLGYRGTFVFCSIVYGAAFLLMAFYFNGRGQNKEFWVLATCMLPVIVYFMIWAVKVWKKQLGSQFFQYDAL